MIARQPRRGRTLRRWAALTAAAAAGTAVLTGCTVGQSSSFTGRAEASCRQTTAQIAALPRPVTASAQLAFALDRYTDVERLVSEVSSDIAFPGGTRGTALRRDWIEPARRSLRTGWTDLERLRAAVRANDRETMPSAFVRAISAGTSGVALGTLRAHGLPDCATSFTPGGVIRY